MDDVSPSSQCRRQNPCKTWEIIHLNLSFHIHSMDKLHKLSIRRVHACSFPLLRESSLAIKQQFSSNSMTFVIVVIMEVNINQADFNSFNPSIVWCVTDSLHVSQLSQFFLLYLVTAYYGNLALPSGHFCCVFNLIKSDALLIFHSGYLPQGELWQH